MAAIQSILTTPDGEQLAVRDWPCDGSQGLGGMALLVHGLGEHSGRYEELAQRLNAQGLAVRAYDHYGHGLSSGPRGGLPSALRLVDDLARVAEATRQGRAANRPLILLGHSMGGLVAAHAVALGRVQVDGLVLSSPALDAGLTFAQRLLLRVLPAVLPNARVHNGLDANGLSHDAVVVQTYMADPLRQDRISARLGRYIADAGPEVLAAAPRWSVPTLLLYAGADKLVNPRGSRAFAQAAPAGMVEVHEFPQHYHEIFNEVAREPVYRQLMQWLASRFKRAG